DHHFNVLGPTLKLRHDLIEDNRKERVISFWIEKHNRYAMLLASEELSLRHTSKMIQPRLFGNPDQRTFWLKRLWYRFPRYARPAVYFIYRYVIRMGFLDGKEGFIFHFLQAF